ncbi:hypothetical protein [Pseudomonas tohonis]|uniref:hypothetical protein n=1 Tax=Pseudomonas tohonis TaxID=2725477 RepID=UPI001F1B87E9|nr:hypothetical protein [Pseudomonas tohonis]GJN44777.1 hypothetical protein TUM20249_07630 [Pseudomonas tohonis]
MKKAVDQIRCNAEFQEAQDGRLFFDQSLAKFTDLSAVRILRCGVDTVRQHYAGLLRPELLALFEGKPAMVDFAGYRFHASRVGRDSGYQFKLQNSDLGFVLLLKNFNCKIDVIGPHLKIEVSPHAIDSHDPERLQAILDRLADEAMTALEPRQCAVHIALDFQGWRPTEDFSSRLHCKATMRRRIDGIETIEWGGKAAIYGCAETFMYGSAGACQMSLYNKTAQARSIDKLDWWQGVWKRRDSFDLDDPLNYDPEQDVWRLEFRFHHSVVQQFADGSASAVSGAFIETRTFAEFAPHLDGLWRYGLGNFRYLSRPGVLDPLWTLFRQDVAVETGVSSLVDETVYVRNYKTANGFSGKNIDLMVGNAISLAARHKVGAKKTLEALRGLPFWAVIQEYYHAKEMTDGDIYKMIKERLEERTVRWGRAV